MKAKKVEPQIMSAVVRANDEALRQAGEALIGGTQATLDAKAKFALATYSDYLTTGLNELNRQHNNSDIERAMKLLGLEHPD